MRTQIESADRKQKSPTKSKIFSNATIWSSVNCF